MLDVATSTQGHWKKNHLYQTWTVNNFFDFRCTHYIFLGFSVIDSTHVDRYLSVFRTALCYHCRRSTAEIVISFLVRHVEEETAFTLFIVVFAMKHLKQTQNGYRGAQNENRDERGTCTATYERSVVARRCDINRRSQQIQHTTRWSTTDDHRAAAYVGLDGKIVDRADWRKIVHDDKTTWL